MPSSGAPLDTTDTTEAGQPTVAAMVASLPPIPVLLGMDPQRTKTSSPPVPRLAARKGCGSATPAALIPLCSSGGRAGAPHTSEPLESGFSLRATWSRVEQSLDLPLVYRKSEEVTLTLRLLRQFGLFAKLTDDELLALAGQMTMFSTRGKGVLIAEKTAVSMDMEGDSEYAVSLSSDDDEAKHAPWLQKHSSAEQAPAEAAASGHSNGVRLGETAKYGPLTARHSCATAVSRQSWPSTAATGDEEYPDSDLYALAQGRAFLEIPTINGKRHFPIQEGDVIGLDVHWQCLPAGSRYVTKEPCTLLKWSPTQGSRLSRVLRRCRKQALEEQKRFLTHELKVPLFTNFPDETDGPSSEEVAAVARCLLPLRLAAEQVVVEQGEEADAMFFVREGRLAVTRTVVQAEPRRQSPTSRPQNSKTRKAVMHDAPARSPREQPRIMEVAELQAGELFGELSLLCYNPDVRPGEGIVWTPEYWRHELETRFQAEANQTAGGEDDDMGGEADFLRSLRRARRSTASSHGLATASASMVGSSTTAPPLPSERIVHDAHENDDDDDERAVLEELRYPPVTAPRLASVYARTPAVIFLIAYDDCRRKIHGKSLTRLSEFVKGYPAHGDLLEEFEKKEQWAMYKKRVVEEVVRKNPNRRAKAPLAPFKH